MRRAEVFLGEIWAGESLEVALVWSTFTGTPEAPAAVSYQTFDATSGLAISTAATASGLASSMTVLIPAARLPGTTGAPRKIRAVIRGTFADGSVAVVVGIITVKPVPTFT